MCCPKPHLDALRTLYAHLHAAPIPWALTGSVGMALQGMRVAVHDVEVQTDLAAFAARTRQQQGRCG